MKKLALAILLVMFTASFCMAEQSAQTYSGNQNIRGDEQSVFIDAYNNSGSAVGSGSVVVIDNASTVASASIGSYFTSTTTAQNPLVLGITAANIPAGSVGRICVRGVCKANLVAPTVALNGSTVTYNSGASLATSTTSLKAATPTAAAVGDAVSGVFGNVLAKSESAGELANQVYYIWVGGPTR